MSAPTFKWIYFVYRTTCGHWIFNCFIIDCRSDQYSSIILIISFSFAETVFKCFGVTAVRRTRHPVVQTCNSNTYSLDNVEKTKPKQTFIWNIMLHLYKNAHTFFILNLCLWSMFHLHHRSISTHKDFMQFKHAIINT